MQTTSVRAGYCAALLIAALFPSSGGIAPSVTSHASCDTNSAFQTAQLSHIRSIVHPLGDPADSAEAYRQATRMPAVDSLLVTFVTSDSLCAVAAKRYGGVRFGDSLRVRSLSLFRLGDSGYVAMGVEGDVDMVGARFLFFTPTWTWRGGSVSPN